MISADDTTGALEAAAQCADAGHRVSVVPWDAVPPTGAGMVVTDLRSRHLDIEGAAARIGSIPRPAVHKIDSTLRGRWDAEVLALVAGGWRVLIVPAFPRAGRTCVGGVVREHGVPVDRTAHATDPRSPVRTSRPSELLPGAVELADADAIAGWRGSGIAIGVADASTDEDVARAVDAVRGDDRVALFGPAALVGAWARRQQVGDPRAEPPAIEAPVVVVCGSLHPSSRAQLRALDGLGGPIVVVSTPDDRVSHTSSADLAESLGERARHTITTVGARTVVVLGGDTAAALLGAEPVRVHGSLGVGIAIGTTRLDGREVVLVTKPGGFGHPGTVVDIVRHLMPT